MKKKNTRGKYPGLNKKKNLKIRQELIDYDYVDKLNPEEKEFLSKFTEEWVSGSFEKNENGNYTKNNLHRTAKQRKECYSRNNKRNVDIFSITKSNDMLKNEKELQAVMEDRSVKSSSLSRRYYYNFTRS